MEILMKSIEVNKDEYLDHIGYYPKSLYHDVAGEYSRWPDVNGKLAAYYSLRNHRYYIVSE